MGNSTLNLPYIYQPVPFTYKNGHVVVYVWNKERNRWELPK